ncbi:Isochorismatase-like protein, partial [Phakopsora pachyrhizi]
KVKYFEQVSRMSEKLLRAAKILDVPILSTEQKPESLGPTIKPLRDLLNSSHIFPKTSFDMLSVVELRDRLFDTLKIKNLIILGIETHICILQTCLKALDHKIDVYVVMADGVSSCNSGETRVALQRIRESGGKITTTESMIYELLKDSNHPRAKEIFKLVKEYSQSTKQAVEALL